MNTTWPVWLSCCFNLWTRRSPLNSGQGTCPDCRLRSPVLTSQWCFYLSPSPTDIDEASISPPFSMHEIWGRFYVTFHPVHRDSTGPFTFWIFVMVVMGLHWMIHVLSVHSLYTVLRWLAKRAVCFQVKWYRWVLKLRV